MTALRRVLAFAVDWLVVVMWAGPVWWLVTLSTSGRTPYDRWSGARVVPR
jgi:hypothetical protein